MLLKLKIRSRLQIGHYSSFALRAVVHAPQKATLRDADRKERHSVRTKKKARRHRRLLIVTPLSAKFQHLLPMYAVHHKLN